MLRMRTTTGRRQNGRTHPTLHCPFLPGLLRCRRTTETVPPPLRHCYNFYHIFHPSSLRSSFFLGIAYTFPFSPTQLARTSAMVPEKQQHAILFSTDWLPNQRTCYSIIGGNTIEGNNTKSGQNRSSSSYSRISVHSPLLLLSPSSPSSRTRLSTQWSYSLTNRRSSTRPTEK